MTKEYHLHSFCSLYGNGYHGKYEDKEKAIKHRNHFNSLMEKYDYFRHFYIIVKEVNDG